MRLFFLFALPLSGSLAACSMNPAAKAPCPEERAYAEALVRMCDVDRQAGITPEADPLGSGPRRTAWIVANVDNPDTIELRTYMSVKGASEQATMLREQAAKVGVRTCALADSLAKTNEGGLAP